MQYFHNTCNVFKPLFSGNIKVTKIFYNSMTFLNSTNINNIYTLELHFTWAHSKDNQIVHFDPAREVWMRGTAGPGFSS